MEVSFIDQDLLWGALKFIFPGLTISWGPTPQYLFRPAQAEFGRFDLF